MAGDGTEQGQVVDQPLQTGHGVAQFSVGAGGTGGDPIVLRIGLVTQGQITSGEGQPDAGQAAAAKGIKAA